MTIVIGREKQTPRNIPEIKKNAAIIPRCTLVFRFNVPVNKAEYQFNLNNRLSSFTWSHGSLIFAATHCKHITRETMCPFQVMYPKGDVVSVFVSSQCKPTLKGHYLPWRIHHC